ncbi:MAG: tetratricopeptide repeat protein [Ignavibacteria bacterium]
MKHKIFLILILSLFSFSFSNLHADDFSDAVVKAKKNFKEAADKNDQKELIKVRGQFERTLQLKKNQWLVNYYLAHVDLELSYSAMQKKDNDGLKKYTQSCLELLDKSTDSKDDFAEAYILKMSANSNRFIYEFDKMNDIIAKLAEAEDMAKKLDPDNPRYHLVKGTNTYYTPEQFGGGPDAALPLLEKSFDLFKTYKPKDETYPDWGNDIAAGMIALCFIQKDKMDEAKKWIDKGLEINPESGFVSVYVMKAYEDKNKK